MENTVQDTYNREVELYVENMKEILKNFIQKYNFKDGCGIDWDSVNDSFAVLKSDLWEAEPSKKEF